MTKSGAARGATIVGAVVAVAPLTWWVALAVPDEVPAERLRYADYAVQPLDLSGGERLAIGLTAFATVVGGLAVLVDGLRSGRVRRDWLRVLFPVAAIAAYLGLGYRVATSAVHGANIGLGFMVLGSFVVVPVLGAVAFVSIWRLAIGDVRHERAGER